MNLWKKYGFLLGLPRYSVTVVCREHRDWEYRALRFWTYRGAVDHAMSFDGRRFDTFVIDYHKGSLAFSRKGADQRVSIPWF